MEATVDWNTVASNRSSGSCLSNFNKRISSKSPNWKIRARWGFSIVWSPLPRLACVEVTHAISIDSYCAWMRLDSDTRVSEGQEKLAKYCEFVCQGWNATELANYVFPLWIVIPVLKDNRACNILRCLMSTLTY